MNDKQLVDMVLLKMKFLLDRYSISEPYINSVRKLESYIANFIQSKKHELTKSDMMLLRICNQDIRVYNVRKQRYKHSSDIKYKKRHKLLSYYNKINSLFFNEYGYPKHTYIVEDRDIYPCKKSRLQLVADYCWLCKIEVESAEFKDNYMIMLPYVKNIGSDLGYKLYKRIHKRPDNMTVEDYNNHWTRVKENYGGSANFIRALPKTSLVNTRQSTIAMKSLLLYNYVYKKKKYSMLKLIKRVRKEPNDKDILELTNFIAKHKIHDNIPPSSTFIKHICILACILKKNGSKRVKSRVKATTDRKKR
jgi:hypothetical protein